MPPRFMRASGLSGLSLIESGKEPDQGSKVLWMLPRFSGVIRFELE